MAKFKNLMRCYNCGTILQSDDPKEEGYIEKRLLEVQSKDAVYYCKNCFDKMKYLNNTVAEKTLDKETAKALDDAVATDSLIVYVVNLFSFDGHIDPDIAKKIKNLKVVVFGTHKDLFATPKDKNLKLFLENSFKTVGINPIKTFVFGSEKNIDIDSLLEQMHKARKGHDVYLIGSVGSGKTTIINKFLKNYKNKTRWAITKENIPGTNVKMLRIPISNSAFVYELPGFSLASSVLGKIEKENAKLIIPKTKAKVVVKALHAKELLMFGTLAFIELNTGVTSTMKIYASDEVDIKTMKTNKLNSFLSSNRITKYTRPCSDRLTNFKDFDAFECTVVKDNKKHEIAIEGLGFVSFMAKGQTFRVLVPKGTSIYENVSRL